MLKGPQGTLYGRNATGGAIVIETLSPPDRFSVSGTASYGNFDDKRAQGYVSGPIAKGIKFSVAGYVRDSDGYITDISAGPLSKSDDLKINSLKDASVRIKLELDPTDNLTVTLGSDYGFVRDDRA